MSSISSMLDFESFSLISSPSRVDYLDSVCNQTSKQHFLHLDYEKIQIVGKGAFGTAILYRRRIDGTYVVIKEVDVGLMNVNERMMAINEIKVLSILKHKNIVTFFNNYEYNSKLFIEMEYCSGGNLADFLSSLSKPMKEMEILIIFEQIVSAISYIHDRNIVHRDLKTENIFMTNEKVFKIGDFGICKVLGSRLIGASTVVGTPHYISPEMAKYDPVKRIYSMRFQKLISDMLQRDPGLRPHAHEIHAEVGELIAKNHLTKFELDMMSNDLSTGASMLTSKLMFKQAKQWRSIVYEVDLNGPSIDLTRLDLHVGEKIVEMDKSSNHFLILTQSCRVYSWGNSAHGKLGLGHVKENVIKEPTVIRELNGRSVFKIAAGEDFSLFACRNGLVFTCGLVESSCLGQEVINDDDSLNVPTIINDLIAHSVVDICCGPRHVIALTDEGNALSWGENFYGQLGHFDEPVSVQLPKMIHFPDRVLIKKIFTGIDASMFIDDQNNLWACGSNEYNKLGLNSTTLFRKTIFNRVYAPKLVKNWRQEKVKSINLTTEITTILLEDGSIIIYGKNLTFCDKNDHQQAPKFTRMNRFCENYVTKIQQTNDFTLAQTYENQIYFLGVRKVHENLMGHLTQSDRNKYEEDDAIRLGEANKSLMNLVELFGPDYPILLLKDPQVIISNSKHLTLLPFSENDIRQDYILQPQVILALYSSHVTLRFGETIEMSNIYCFHDRKIFLIIDTTIPAPEKLITAKKRRNPRRPNLLPVLFEEGSNNSFVNPLKSLKNSIDLFDIQLKTSRNSLHPKRLENVLDTHIEGTISWTFPPNNKRMQERAREERLTRQIKLLRDKLAENERKIDEYKGLVEELEDRFNRIKKARNDIKFCILN